MAGARTSKARAEKEERKQEDEEEEEEEEEEKGKKEEKPNPPPPISIPDRSAAEALFKESSSRSSAETLTLTDQDPSCRSFSQLLAGAMASPAAVVANSSPAAVLEVKPTLVLTLAVDPVRFPLVAQPAFIGVLSPGQFGMTHQEALASVTAQAQVQAQMQLQTGYPSPSLAVPPKSPIQTIMSPLSPTPLQQRKPLVSEDNVSMADMEHITSLDHKPQSAHGNVKTPSSDGYNWRKYGQKQVKSSESSRSYYRCTQVNCTAKKKIERCHDGHVAEIIYKGQHNHEPPQKIRCKKEGDASSGAPSGGNETDDVAGENMSESNPSSRTEQHSCQTLPEPQLHSSSNCDGEADTGADEERGDEPDPKRRNKENSVSHSTPLLKTVKEPKVVVQTGSDPGSLGDGYRWRKYGQKIVKGNPNPRSYYKCTHVGCPVRKHVERSTDDQKALIITYEGIHNHESPGSKSSYDTPSTPVSPAPASVSTGGKLKTSQTPVELPSAQSPTDAEGKLAGEKAKELGGEKALESAQTLLSIGLKSDPSEEDAGAKNPNVIQRPLFNENSSAVSV